MLQNTAFSILKLGYSTFITGEAGTGKSYLIKETKNLLAKKIILEEIAKARNLTAGTIITHIEKLINGGEKIDIKYLLPKDKELSSVKKIFTKNKDAKLTLIYEKLEGKYSYEDLRLMRAHFKQ